MPAYKKLPFTVKNKETLKVVDPCFGALYKINSSNPRLKVERFGFDVRTGYPGFMFNEYGRGYHYTGTGDLVRSYGSFSFKSWHIHKSYVSYGYPFNTEDDDLVVEQWRGEMWECSYDRGENKFVGKEYYIRYEKRISFSYDELDDAIPGSGRFVEEGKKGWYEGNYYINGFRPSFKVYETLEGNGKYVNQVFLNFDEEPESGSGSDSFECTSPPGWAGMQGKDGEGDEYEWEYELSDELSYNHKVKNDGEPEKISVTGRALIMCEGSIDVDVTLVPERLDDFEFSPEELTIEDGVINEDLEVKYDELDDYFVGVGIFDYKGWQWNDVIFEIWTKSKLTVKEEGRPDVSGDYGVSKGHYEVMDGAY